MHLVRCWPALLLVLAGVGDCTTLKAGGSTKDMSCAAPVQEITQSKDRAMVLLQVSSSQAAGSLGNADANITATTVADKPMLDHQVMVEEKRRVKGAQQLVENVKQEPIEEAASAWTGLAARKGAEDKAHKKGAQSFHEASIEKGSRKDIHDLEETAQDFEEDDDSDAEYEEDDEGAASEEAGSYSIAGMEDEDEEEAAEEEEYASGAARQKEDSSSDDVEVSSQETKGRLSLVESDEAATAAFSEQGYDKVAGTRSGHKMEVYIRRLIDHLGLQVVDQGGLKGFVPYYSGIKDTQSFEALREELLSTASEDGWLQSMPAGQREHMLIQTEGTRNEVMQQSRVFDSASLSNRALTCLARIPQMTYDLFGYTSTMIICGVMLAMGLCVIDERKRTTKNLDDFLEPPLLNASPTPPVMLENPCVTQRLEDLRTGKR